MKLHKNVQSLVNISLLASTMKHHVSENKSDIDQKMKSSETFHDKIHPSDSQKSTKGFSITRFFKKKKISPTVPEENNHTCEDEKKKPSKSTSLFKVFKKKVSSVFKPVHQEKCGSNDDFDQKKVNTSEEILCKKDTVEVTKKEFDQTDISKNYIVDSSDSEGKCNLDGLDGETINSVEGEINNSTKDKLNEEIPPPVSAGNSFPPTENDSEKVCDRSWVETGRFIAKWLFRAVVGTVVIATVAISLPITWPVILVFCYICHDEIKHMFDDFG